MTAYLNLRYALRSRYDAVAAGIESASGCSDIRQGFPDRGIKKGDIFVTWNRIGAGENWARRFTELGCPVIVLENATWGNDFLGGRWYHAALNYHNTARCFPVGGSSRWDDLGISLPDFVDRENVILLPQRGIGSPPTRMPANFLRKMQKKYPGAIVRRHPGARGKAIPLEDDLKSAGLAVTWGSGAAVKALMLGVPVDSYMPNWIAEQDNTIGGRLAMFRQLAWAQWRLSEISDGVPFKRLLDYHVSKI